VIRTLTRRVFCWLAAPAALACCAASVYAQAGKKGAPTPAADSGGFFGEFVLAFCAVGFILWAVCAPSHRAT
jgi:hypothetical protein